MALEDDLRLYQSVRAELVANFLNQFVLIKDERVIAVYSTYDEALNAALQMFGTEQFLIKQILDPEPVETI